MSYILDSMDSDPGFFPLTCPGGGVSKLAVKAVMAAKETMYEFWDKTSMCLLEREGKRRRRRRGTFRERKKMPEERHILYESTTVDVDVDVDVDVRQT
eukprot:CAMPEP_0175054988 /NCGR_PEP_ID=MMETSP0052_2-20121109/9820_1 /TAXON_ID=51329 ORGANISM="Polytomella parva, Strain SAG 63-3" /NCGR_SAMPLE_ID=MMETSP0052_2 /ASSEMBLY_ACC=CAM_ASM_000194 /LENGTH=97 /DNA_ID=CAMNT_0016319763 /DNA_START=126 /DNA_END=419 /DNA_ORIENTATION=-